MHDFGVNIKWFRYLLSLLQNNNLSDTLVLLSSLDLRRLLIRDHKMIIAKNV
jgi:hypothetical protein